MASSRADDADRGLYILHVRAVADLFGPIVTPGLAALQVHIDDARPALHRDRVDLPRDRRDNGVGSRLGRPLHVLRVPPVGKRRGVAPESCLTKMDQ